MKRRDWRFAALIAAAVLATLPAKAADVVITNFGTNIFGVPYSVGLEKGIFKEAGAPVTGVLNGGGGGSVLRALLANDLPFGEVATTTVIAAQHEGLDVVAVCGALHTFDDTYFVLPGSPIHTVPDWVGKRIAYTSPQSSSQADALIVLAHFGVAPSAVTMVATGGYAQGLTMLDIGAVDVAMAGAPLSYFKGTKYRAIIKSDDVQEPTLAGLCVTTRAYLKAHPDTIRAILLARRRAIAYVNAHPKESGAIAARAYDLDPEIFSHAVEDATKARAPIWVPGDIDMNELIRLQDGMRLTGLNVDADWSKLIDLSYLPEDLQAKSHLTAH